MAERAWSLRSVDSRTPTDTRVYDYALGGKDNYAADRDFAERLLAVAPDTRLMAAENARFTRRAVRTLFDAGIRQFLDIGCGLPRRVNVHDLAGPEGRVVYVDYDPVAVIHFEAALSGNSTAAVIHADARDPGSVLTDPAVTELIDLDRPVGLLMTFLLHLISDDDHPERIVADFRDALTPGSHLVLSHVTHEGRPPAVVQAVDEICAALREPVTLRGRDRISRLFDGFSLVEPGLVPAPDWRPDRPHRTSSGWVLAGVGRKP